MKRRRNGAGTLYRRGPVWYCKIKVGGKWLCKSTGCAEKNEARKKLDEMAMGCDLSDEARLAAVAAALRGRAGTPKIADAWAVFERRHPDADAKPRRWWRAFMDWMAANRPAAKTLADVTEDDARAWAREVAEHRSPHTANCAVNCARRVWREAADGGKTPFDGVRRLAESHALRRALTDEELRRVLDTAQGELKALFAIGAYTGLRLGDAAKVRWEDFSADGRTLTVKPSKTARTSGKVVAIPVHHELRETVGSGEGRSGWITPTFAEMDAAKRVGLVMAHLAKCVKMDRERKPDHYRRATPDVGFHSLRATFITRLANAGTPLPVVQALVGHATPTMCMRYYRADADVARAFVDGLPDW